MVFIWFYLYVLQGYTIHATVNEDVVPIFESFLEEGDSKIFINFKPEQYTVLIIINFKPE